MDDQKTIVPAKEFKTFAHKVESRVGCEAIPCAILGYEIPNRKQLANAYKALMTADWEQNFKFAVGHATYRQSTLVLFIFVSGDTSNEIKNGVLEVSEKLRSFDIAHYTHGTAGMPNRRALDNSLRPTGLKPS